MQNKFIFDIISQMTQQPQQPRHPTTAVVNTTTTTAPSVAAQQQQQQLKDAGTAAVSGNFTTKAQQQKNSGTFCRPCLRKSSSAFFGCGSRHLWAKPQDSGLGSWMANNSPSETRTAQGTVTYHASKIIEPQGGASPIKGSGLETRDSHGETDDGHSHSQLPSRYFRCCYCFSLVCGGCYLRDRRVCEHSCQFLLLTQLMPVFPCHDRRNLVCAWLLLHGVFASFWR